MVKEKNGEIEAVHIFKQFINSDGETIVALNDVNVTIRPGEFISLIGPSGCGKTTFLRLVSGLDKANSGEITLDGEKIVKAGYERGLVFQDPTLFPWLNIRENVAYGLSTRGVYKEKKREVGEFIKLVGLEGFEKSYPHQLSGGMAQRAALARALVNHPKVLLLDEPFGALDAFTRMNMQDELLKIWKDRGTTMVMVTHDVDEAIYLSDRIVVMSARPAKIEGMIDAIAMNDPTAYIAANEYGFTTLFHSATDEPYNKQYCCSIYMRNEFIENHPELTEKYTIAIQKASAWVQENQEETAKIQVDNEWVAGDTVGNAEVLKLLIIFLQPVGLMKHLESLQIKCRI